MATERKRKTSPSAWKGEEETASQLPAVAPKNNSRLYRYFILRRKLFCRADKNLRLLVEAFLFDIFIIIPWSSLFGSHSWKSRKKRESRKTTATNSTEPDKFDFQPVETMMVVLFNFFLSPEFGRSVVSSP